MININLKITFIVAAAVMVCTQVAIRTSTMYCVSLPLSNGEQEVKLVLPADNYNISFSTNLGNFLFDTRIEFIEVILILKLNKMIKFYSMVKIFKMCRLMLWKKPILSQSISMSKKMKTLRICFLI